MKYTLVKVLDTNDKESYKGQYLILKGTYSQNQSIIDSCNDEREGKEAFKLWVTNFGK